MRRYSPRTESSYLGWIRAFIRFHGRHPRELGERHVAEFLSHLAVNRDVAASTQNQALAALVFHYREVLGIDLNSSIDLVRARQSHRLPDIFRGELTIRGGKGARDRRTVLSQSIAEPLRHHLAAVRGVHQRDVERGNGAVALPDALARKFPSAAREWP